MANEIKALYQPFVLIGEVLKKECETKTSVSGYTYSKLKLGIKTAEGNVLFTENMGGFKAMPDVIKAKDKDKNDLEIAWADRFNPAIVERVADYQKFKVNTTSSDTKESTAFLSEYDAIQFINLNLQEKARVVVLGNIVIQRYEAQDGTKKVSQKLKVQQIRLAKEDEKNIAEATFNFVFNSDSIDKSSLIKEGKVDITGYVTSYVKAIKEQEFVPVLLTLDFNHLKSSVEKNFGRKFDESQTPMLQNLYLQQYLSDGIEKNKYYQTQWKVDLVRGSQVEEISEADLSAEQKMLIEMGIATFEQIKASMGGNRFGDKVDEKRLLMPTTRLETEDGVKVVNLLTPYVEEDFYAKTGQTISQEQMLGGIGATPTQSMENTIKNLFGGSGLV